MDDGKTLYLSGKIWSEINLIMPIRQFLGDQCVFRFEGKNVYMEKCK